MKNSIIHEKISFFDLLTFLTYSHLSYFRFLVLICTVGKYIGHFFKNNKLKISTQTLKKLVLSSLASHTSYASNSTRTSITSRLGNKDINTNQNKNIFQIQMTSTHVYHHKNEITVFGPHLQPLIWCHWMLDFLLHLFSYTQQINYPLLVNNICVFRLTVNFLMLPSV